MASKPVTATNLRVAEPVDLLRFMFAVGIECSYPTIEGNQRVDQMRSCGHYDLCSGGYNLIKYRRFGTFDATETPECSVHVKTMVDTLLSHINDHACRSAS